MLIKRENERLYSILFDSTEIDFLRFGLSFDTEHISRWLRECVSNRLAELGYSILRKEKPNELEG